ncbi:hypothetical protein SAMN06295937_103310 [Sphingopyxis flava]|uniref:Uncharacterized protein n=1 Tax=Sphingopyxis flava TaxID=1507287 RepID=A0A1T5FDP6_9SPHN|nr:hypothetical protein SAMN06295937_103310 [Sphingopyxis flava]
MRPLPPGLGLDVQEQPPASNERIPTGDGLRVARRHACRSLLPQWDICDPEIGTSGSDCADAKPAPPAIAATTATALIFIKFIQHLPSDNAPRVMTKRLMPAAPEIFASPLKKVETSFRQILKTMNYILFK